MQLLTTDQGLRTPLVLNLRPVDREIEVRIIGLFVTTHAPYGRSYKSVAFCGIAGVRKPRAVTLLALHVGELRRRVERLEAAFLIPDDVAPNAFIVELLVLLFEGRHRVGVPRRLPNLMLFLVTRRTSRFARVRRIHASQHRRRF